MANDANSNDLPVTVNDLAMRAVKLFREGMDCEAAVVTVFDEFLGARLLDGLEPETRRTGLGFQVPCGALIGATRVLAKVLENDESLAKQRLELEKLFVIKHGATTCQYLTAHVKWGEHRLRCGKYVYTAVESLWAILEERLGKKLTDILEGTNISDTKH